MVSKMVNQKLNIVFTGFPYPQGLAGTKDNQNAIDALKKYNVSAKVLVLRQSSKINVPNGIYNGVPYETIGPDLWRWRFLLTSPVFFLKSMKAIQKEFCTYSRNIFYISGPPDFNNFPMIRQARKCGYKIVFYIVEDYDVAWNRSSSLWFKAEKTHRRKQRAGR